MTLFITRHNKTYEISEMYVLALSFIIVYSVNKLSIRVIEKHITVSESFYKFQYPFHFPKSFYTFENKRDFKLKFGIIQSFSHQLSTRKVLHLEDLFNTLNNQNKSYMKNNLI